jgi:hypothetical protein
MKHTWNIHETIQDFIVDENLLFYLHMWFKYMISIFKQYKPMKKLNLHDYYCQIMTQKVSCIYIYRLPIFTLGIPMDLKSEIEMWLL